MVRSSPTLRPDSAGHSGPFIYLVCRREASSLIPRQTSHRAPAVMGEEEATSPLQQVSKQRLLLLDQQFRKAVVAHSDRQVHPGSPWNEIPSEQKGTIDRRDLRQQKPRGVTVTDVKANVLAQNLCMLARHDLQPTGVRQLAVQGLDKTRTVSKMGMHRPIPCTGTHDKRRVREEEARFLPLRPGREQAPSVVEVQMRQDNDVNIFMAQTEPSERRQKHVIFLDDPKTIAQLRWKEHPDPRFEENSSFIFFDEQSATGQRDSVALIWLNPARPKGFRGISKHRPTV